MGLALALDMQSVSHKILSVWQMCVIFEYINGSAFLMACIWDRKDSLRHIPESISEWIVEEGTDSEILHSEQAT